VAPVRRFPDVAQAAQTAGWRPGPASPALQADSVDVWRADLAGAGDELAASLSEQERSRAAGFPSPAAGRLWAASRGILRELLARYTAERPQDVPLHADQSGRLSLPGPVQLSFSLSHSGQLALYAFASAVPVGVDVETARSINETALARRLLGAAQAQALSRLPAAERRRELLRAWTRREARLKCMQAGEAGEPWLIDLDVGGGAAGALAGLGGGPPAVRLWDLA